MDEELSTFRGVAAYNVLTQSCAMDKVDALNDILDKARTSGTLPRIGEIGFTRDFGAFGDSWQLAQSSDVMLHMSPKETMMQASRWVNIRAVSKMGADAQTAWQQLALLQNRPGPISADTVDTVTKDLIVAAYSVGMMNGIGGREDGRLGEQGIPRLLPNGEPWSLPTIKKWAAEAPICIPLLVDGKPYLSTRPKYSVDLPKDLVG